VSNDKKANWLGIIPDKKTGLKIEAEAVSEMNSVLRTLTSHAKQSDDPNTVKLGQQASQGRGCRSCEGR
jgi:hypothetical protein